MYRNYVVYYSLMFISSSSNSVSLPPQLHVSYQMPLVASCRCQRQVRSGVTSHCRIQYSRQYCQGIISLLQDFCETAPACRQSADCRILNWSTLCQGLAVCSEGQSPSVCRLLWPPLLTRHEPLSDSMVSCMSNCVVAWCALILRSPRYLLQRGYIQ